MLKPFNVLEVRAEDEKLLRNLPESMQREADTITAFMGSSVGFAGRCPPEYMAAQAITDRATDEELKVLCVAHPQPAVRLYCLEELARRAQLFDGDSETNQILFAVLQRLVLDKSMCRSQSGCIIQPKLVRTVAIPFINLLPREEARFVGQLVLDHGSPQEYATVLLQRAEDTTRSPEEIQYDLTLTKAAVEDNDTLWRALVTYDDEDVLHNMIPSVIQPSSPLNIAPHILKSIVNALRVDRHMSLLPLLEKCFKLIERTPVNFQTVGHWCLYLEGIVNLSKECCERVHQILKSAVEFACKMHPLHLEDLRRRRESREFIPNKLNPFADGVTHTMTKMDPSFHRILTPYVFRLFSECDFLTQWSIELLLNGGTSGCSPDELALWHSFASGKLDNHSMIYHLHTDLLKVIFSFFRSPSMRQQTIQFILSHSGINLIEASEDLCSPCCVVFQRGICYEKRLLEPFLRALIEDEHPTLLSIFTVLSKRCDSLDSDWIFPLMGQIPLAVYQYHNICPPYAVFISILQDRGPNIGAMGIKLLESMQLDSFQST